MSTSGKYWQPWRIGLQKHVDGIVEGKGARFRRQVETQLKALAACVGESAASQPVISYASEERQSLIRAVLDEDPTLSVRAIVEQTGIPRSVVQRIRQAYLKNRGIASTPRGRPKKQKGETP